jgi:hypothetical protein
VDVGFAEPQDKNHQSHLYLYFLVIFCHPKFSLFTCKISLSIIHILEEQSSEGKFSLFSLLKLGFSLH